MSSKSVSLLVAISRLFFPNEQLPNFAPSYGWLIQHDERSCVKNESGFEQGLRIFNWISIQLGSKTIISCGVQKENLLLQALVQWWRRGDVKIPSPFKFDGMLMLEGNVMPYSRCRGKAAPVRVTAEGVMLRYLMVQMELCFAYLVFTSISLVSGF